MISENALKVLNFVKENGANNITAADIAEGTGLPVRSVNGIVTAAFQKKELMERVEAEVELEDGTHKKVKFIKLTEKGEDFDPNAQEEAAE